MPRKKVAVVLFNLGGPDGPAAVEPFLFNLFDDPAIIGAPRPVRWALAKLIARRRAPVARAIYAEIGGASPLLARTRAQAEALMAAFAGHPELEVRAWPCMRYWHPRADAVAREVAAHGPDRVVLLPLYPQFSTTTTASSARDWDRAAAAAGLRRPTARICCYPDHDGFITALAGLTAEALAELEARGQAPRVLFSAHGLPERIVARGDPYPDQVARTARAVVDRLGRPDLDWLLAFQSRVGPLRWIGPATDAEIARAGREGRPLLVVPVAFVSEHSETLVELDIEYARLARDHGVPRYARVPTVGTHPAFIAGLARMVEGAVAGGDGWESGTIGGCDATRTGCPRR